MRKTNEVSLKLSAQGEEQLKKALRETGEEGKKMAALIDRSGKRAGKGLKSVDAGVKELKMSAESMTDRLGPAGSALKALGPIGLGAAAGITAVVASLGAAVRIGQEAVSSFSEVGHSADRLGLATDTFQAITFEMDQMGISQSQLETGMKALAERQAQIITGQGELYSRLKDTNPELLKQLEALDSQEDRLRAVVKALSDAESQTERNVIAYAAFGEAGEQLQRVFTNQEDGIDGLISQASELGLVIDESLVRRSQDLTDEMAIARQVMDLQLKQAFVDFAPVALEGAKALAEVAEWASSVADSMRDIRDQSDKTLTSRLDDLTVVMRRAGVEAETLDRALKGLQSLDGNDLPALQRMTKTGDRLTDLMAEFNQIVAERAIRGEQQRADTFFADTAGLDDSVIDEQMATLRSQLDTLESEIQAEVDRRVANTDGGLLDPLFRKGVEGVVNLERGQDRAQIQNDLAALQQRKELNATLEDEREARRKLADSIRRQREAEANARKQAAEQAKIERERVQLTKQAALLALELGDATDALVMKQAEYQKLVEAGLLTQDQANELLKRYEDRVTGVTAATDKWLAVVDRGTSEVDRINQALDALDADFIAGMFNGSAESAQLYIDALNQLHSELVAATEAERALTDEFKAAAEIREKLAEAREAQLTVEEKIASQQAELNDLVSSGNLSQQEALDYLELYREKLAETRDEVDLLTEAENILDGAMNGRIKTLGDLGDALLKLITDVITQQAMARAQAGSLGGFGGFLGDIFSGTLGAFGLGGGGSGSAPAVPVSHRGSRGSHAPKEVRSLSQGYGRNEKLVLMERTQELISQPERMQIIDYIRDRQSADAIMPAFAAPSAMQLGLNISVRSEGGTGPVDTQVSQDGQGNVSIDLLLGDKVKGMARSGELNKALEGNGFVRRPGAS